MSGQECSYCGGDHNISECDWLEESPAAEELRRTYEGEDKAAAAAAVNAMFAEIARHDEHVWEQVGRCVDCVDCSKRLYQGRIPTTHAKVKVPRRWSGASKAAQEMRERWGMDNRPSAQGEGR